MKLMQIIVLSCKKATFYSSIKNFKKLSWVRRLQLKLHFSMCDACHEFDHQSVLIDRSLEDLHKNKNLLSDAELSAEKKAAINSSVNQRIK